MAKAATGGYDGRGHPAITNSEELKALLQRVEQRRNTGCLRNLWPLDQELAFVLARIARGTTHGCFPVGGKQERICDGLLAPAAISQAGRPGPATWRSRCSLPWINAGVPRRSIFLTRNGRLADHELAPEPIIPRSLHDRSGTQHTASQFAQQVRLSVVTLGPTDLKAAHDCPVGPIAGYESSDRHLTKKRTPGPFRLPGASLLEYQAGFDPRPEAGSRSPCGPEGTDPAQRTTEAARRP